MAIKHSQLALMMESAPSRQRAYEALLHRALMCLEYVDGLKYENGSPITGYGVRGELQSDIRAFFDTRAEAEKGGELADRIDALRKLYVEINDVGEYTKVLALLKEAAAYIRGTKERV